MSLLATLLTNDEPDTTPWGLRMVDEVETFEVVSARRWWNKYAIVVPTEPMDLLEIWFSVYKDKDGCGFRTTSEARVGTRMLGGLCKMISLTRSDDGKTYEVVVEEYPEHWTEFTIQPTDRRDKQR